MVHVLGVNLPDKRLVKIALTSFYGIGHYASKLVCARLGFHDRLMVSDLTETQINELSALLSAPASFMEAQPPSSSKSAKAGPSKEHQYLANLLIEADLKREVRANIQHHRTVGSYRGRRHAMGFPVRGQRTKSNAKTAKKLNRVERRAFSTSTGSTPPSSSISSLPTSQPPSPFLHSLRWRFRLANSRMS